MALSITKKLLSKDLDGKHYNSTKQNNVWIVIHNTGGGTANSAYNWFNNPANTAKTSAHYCVDDENIIQCLENDWKGHHCGGSGQNYNDKYTPANATDCTNSNSIGIEIADWGGEYTKEQFNKAIENAIDLTISLMKQMNIDWSHVIRHGDTQAKDCPHYIMKEDKWSYFKEQLGNRTGASDPIEPSDPILSNKFVYSPEYHWNIKLVPYNDNIQDNIVRNKIVEMAKQIKSDYDNGIAKYSQSPRTVDYTKPQYCSDGKVGYDHSSLVSCCYKYAGLNSMYNKSCSGGTLMNEIVDNGGEMWLCNDDGIKKAKPGDLIVNGSGNMDESKMPYKASISHVMVYIGDNTVIHASSPTNGIKQNEISNYYKSGKYAFVRPRDLIDIAYSNKSKYPRRYEAIFELKPSEEEYPYRIIFLDKKRKIRYDSYEDYSGPSQNWNELDYFLDTKDYSHQGRQMKEFTQVRNDITDASWLFAECWYATNTEWFPPVRSELIEDMSYMFYNCIRLEELDLSNYYTNNVKNMDHMFDACINLKKLDIRNFNMDLIDRVSCMFMGCISLEELRLDNCSRETIRKIISTMFFPVPIEKDKWLNDEIANQVYNILINLGYTSESACGIMGNLQQMSGMDPTRYQSGGGKGRGICQWIADSDRFQGLENYAASKGKDWTDLQSQIEWLDMELQGKDPTTLKYLKEFVGGYENFKQLTNVNKACQVFENSFERAGKPMMEKRYMYAEQYYKSVKSKEIFFGYIYCKEENTEGLTAPVGWQFIYV